jgi:hypothetical protein
MEKNLTISINEAYKNVKILAATKNCKIIYDEPYKEIILAHGRYTFLPSSNIKKIFRIKFLENKIFVNYWLPKSIIILDILIYGSFLTILTISYFYFASIIEIIQASLPEAPPGLLFGDASAFVEMLKIVEAFIILGIIIVVIMLPLNLIKYRMSRRFVKEFLDYI